MIACIWLLPTVLLLVAVVFQRVIKTSGTQAPFLFQFLGKGPESITFEFQVSMGVQSLTIK